MRSATCPADWEQLNNVSRSARRAIQGCVVKGCSSVGRAAVSKTAGRGFETLRPCHFRKAGIGAMRNRRSRRDALSVVASVGRRSVMTYRLCPCRGVYVATSMSRLGGSGTSSPHHNSRWTLCRGWAMRGLSLVPLS